MRLDLTGNRFGRLVVQSFAGLKSRTALWNCLCDCGISVVVRSGNLRRNTRSCGCLRKARAKQLNRTHGMTHTPEFRAYVDARSRCVNRNAKCWPNYGGRGIEFRFTSFEQWVAELGPRPSPKHSVDRYPNNDGHYEPGNVRWATPKEQIQNQRPKQPRHTARETERVNT
jgi:hypothetical protein